VFDYSQLLSTANPTIPLTLRQAAGVNTSLDQEGLETMTNSSTLQSLSNKFNPQQTTGDALLPDAPANVMTLLNLMNQHPEPIPSKQAVQPAVNSESQAPSLPIRAFEDISNVFNSKVDAARKAFMGASPAFKPSETFPSSKVDVTTLCPNHNPAFPFVSPLHKSLGANEVPAPTPIRSSVMDTMTNTHTSAKNEIKAFNTMIDQFANKVSCLFSNGSF